MTESVGGNFSYVHFPIINVVKFLIASIAKVFPASRPQGIRKSYEIYPISLLLYGTSFFESQAYVFQSLYLSWCTTLDIGFCNNTCMRGWFRVFNESSRLCY